MASFSSRNLKSSDDLYKLDIFFEIIFGISMILEFLTDFEEFPGQLPVRDIAMIAKKYMKGRFLLDLLSLIPFN
jgi:hypothetical protein